MLEREYGNGLTTGVYERERLRRRARQLGLRILKPLDPGVQALKDAAAPCNAKETRSPGKRNLEQATELDKCG
jgi:hypothetical protein